MIADITGWVKQRPGESIFWLLCLFLGCFIAVKVVGVVSAEKPQIQAILRPSEPKINAQGGGLSPVFKGTDPAPTPLTPRDSRVVSSKKSKKYHFTWCPGFKQIKEENRIWFATEGEALGQGYTLAGNCKK